MEIFFGAWRFFPGDLLGRKFDPLRAGSSPWPDESLSEATMGANSPEVSKHRANSPGGLGMANWGQGYWMIFFFFF